MGNIPPTKNQQDVEILQLNAVMVFSVVTFATKLNLSGFKAFESLLEENHMIDSNLAEFIKSLFLNDMVDWQQETLAPLSEEIFKQHQCNFVESVTEHHQGGAVHLHIQLIMKSSSLLLKILNARNANIGKVTVSQIQAWSKFVIKYLDRCQTRFKGLHRTKTTVEPLLSETLDMLHKIGRLTNKEWSGKEYAFFHHKSLFIYLAQVVYMECHVFKRVTEDIESWHFLCGVSFNDLFQVSSYSPLSSEDSIQKFPFMGKLVAHPPNLLDLYDGKFLHVHAIHVGTLMVVDRYMECLQNGMDDLSLDEAEEFQLETWKRFMRKAFAVNEYRMQRLQGRKKIKKSYLKTQEKAHTGSNRSSYKYKPRRPGRFENDTYLLGDCSLYQIFSSNGKPASEATKMIQQVSDKMLDAASPFSDNRQSNHRT